MTALIAGDCSATRGKPMNHRSLAAVFVSPARSVGGNSHVKTTTRALGSGDADAVVNQSAGANRHNHRYSSHMAPRGEFLISDRSEERRVGKECRSRWSPY